jgi:hypothetical protein
MGQEWLHHWLFDAQFGCREFTSAVNHRQIAQNYQLSFVSINMAS